MCHLGLCTPLILCTLVSCESVWSAVSLSGQSRICIHHRVQNKDDPLPRVRVATGHKVENLEGTVMPRSLAKQKLLVL